MFNEMMSALETCNNLEESRRVGDVFSREISKIHQKIGSGKRKLEPGSTYCVDVVDGKESCRRRFASCNM
jgi:hypothetical protein